jgi:hypothetical protein
MTAPNSALIGRKIKLTGSGWNADAYAPEAGTVHEIMGVDSDGDVSFRVSVSDVEVEGWTARLPNNPRSPLSRDWLAELVDEAPAPQAPATAPRSTEEIDAEKAARPRPDLFPARAIEAGGRAFGYGAKKHGGV